ncbi:MULTISPECIES: hypothetical protein [Bacillus cereus group]|uniref:hypothetical protein n=1 Tax=Bacillus cereus group TaxID=86661 RepID=UPI002E24D06D
MKGVMNMGDFLIGLFSLIVVLILLLLFYIGIRYTKIVGIVFGAFPLTLVFLFLLYKFLETTGQLVNEIYNNAGVKGIIIGVFGFCFILGIVGLIVNANEKQIRKEEF